MIGARHFVDGVRIRHFPQRGSETPVIAAWTRDEETGKRTFLPDDEAGKLLLKHLSDGSCTCNANYPRPPWDPPTRKRATDG